MGLRNVVASLLGRLTGTTRDGQSGESDRDPATADRDPATADRDPATADRDPAAKTIQSIELPGGADWEQASALVVAEGGTEYELTLPDGLDDPNRPLEIQFGGTSDEPNTVIWKDPPEVTAAAEILIEDPDGEVRPIPRTERRGT